MGTIHLKLLGQFECKTDDDKAISLQTRKAEALLAYLALEPGIRHPRERLINLLWSDRGEEQARNSLRQALSAIKKPLSGLAESPLNVDRTTVLLDPGLVQVDAIEFEQSANANDIERLSQAASLYQGEFMEGVSIRDRASEEWLTQQREHYKRSIVDILTRLSDMQSAAGEYVAAIQSAEQLIIHDPLTESAWRTLMTAYHANHDLSLIHI